MAGALPIQSLSRDAVVDKDGELDAEKLLQLLNLQEGATYRALAGGLTFTENFSARLRTVRVAMPANSPKLPAALMADSWPHYAAYGTAVSQTMTNAASVIVDFSTAQISSPHVTTGSAWKFTVPVGGAGIYEVSAAVTVSFPDPAAAGSTCLVAIFKNGSEAHRLARLSNAACTGLCQIGGRHLISLAAADFVDIRVYQSSGANRSLEATVLGNHVAINRCFQAPSSGVAPVFSAPGWPILLRHDLPKAAGLIPVACSVVNGGKDESVGQYTVDWEDKGDGQLRIKAVWGLQWGKVYNLTVLVFAG